MKERLLATIARRSLLRRNLSEWHNADLARCRLLCRHRAHSRHGATTQNRSMLTRNAGGTGVNRVETDVNWTRSHCLPYGAGRQARQRDAELRLFRYQRRRRGGHGSLFDPGLKFMPAVLDGRHYPSRLAGGLSAKTGNRVLAQKSQFLIRQPSIGSLRPMSANCPAARTSCAAPVQLRAT